jgi:hypothetical protein
MSVESSSSTASLALGGTGGEEFDSPLLGASGSIGPGPRTTTGSGSNGLGNEMRTARE